jgi:hypothetical protein
MRDPRTDARVGRQAQLRLRSLFRDQRSRRFFGLEFRDFHFLPVIAEFPAAIQADHVGPGAGDGRSAARVRAHGDRKTVTGVPAAKYRVHHLRKHRFNL